MILGTVQFGLDYGVNNAIGKPPKDLVVEMLDHAFDHEIKVLDTAEAYGNATELIGNYNLISNNSYLINTKLQSGNSNLSKQLKVSLSKLNQDSVNVYFFHSFKDFINYPELKSQLIDLKKRGKVKKIGLSIYENREFEIAINSDFIDVIQFPFNLLDNYSLRGELIKIAKKKGKELQVRSIFLQGLFFKPLNELPSNLKPLLPYLEKIHEISDIPIEQLAISYAMQQHEIDNVIIGVDSMQQLEKNIEMSKEVISNDIIEAINQINVKKVELLYPKNW